MIRKLDIIDYFTDDDIKIINSVASIDELEWGKQDHLLKIIHENLLIKQKNSVLGDYLEVYDCAYCGSRLDVGGRKEVEHIDLKSKFKYYQYYPLNLVFICSHCNGSSKKGRKNVVAGKVDEVNHAFLVDDTELYKKIEESYSKLKFSIVHPIKDDPDEHIEWTDESKTVIKKHKTSKGEKTIEMFMLDSLEMTLNRIREKDEEIRFLENPEIYIELAEKFKK